MCSDDLPPPLTCLQPARRSVAVRAAGWDLSAEVPAHLANRKDLAGSELLRHRRRHRQHQAATLGAAPAALEQPGSKLGSPAWCTGQRQKQLHVPIAAAPQPTPLDRSALAPPPQCHPPPHLPPALPPRSCHRQPRLFLPLQTMASTP